MSKKEMKRAARIAMDRRSGIARQDMALGLSGLFRVLPGGGTRRAVEIRQPWCGGEIIIAGVECGPVDQAILLALLALAGQSDPLPEPGAPPDLLAARGAAVQREVVRVSASLAALMRTAGLDPDSHGSRHAVRASLRRLSGIVIEGRRGQDWAMTHLIAGAAGHGCDAVVVALNYRLTDALMGLSSYARIEMGQYLSLETGVARLTYAWLCAWYAASAGLRRIGLDALEAHVYGAAATSKSAQSKRRSALRAALAQIDKLPGWRAAVDSAGMVITVRRGDEATNRLSGKPKPAFRETGQTLIASTGAASGPSEEAYETPHQEEAPGPVPALGGAGPRSRKAGFTS